MYQDCSLLHPAFLHLSWWLHHWLRCPYNVTEVRWYLLLCRMYPRAAPRHNWGQRGRLLQQFCSLQSQTWSLQQGEMQSWPLHAYCSSHLQSVFPVQLCSEWSLVVTVNPLCTSSRCDLGWSWCHQSCGVWIRAGNEPSRSVTITEKAPTRAFSWLISPTNALIY